MVGWPPVRNYRRNEVLKMRSNKNKLVKVAVDGAPYLRKVDLEAYSGYQQLLSALQDMFSCFTIRLYSFHLYSKLINIHFHFHFHFHHN